MFDQKKMHYDLALLYAKSKMDRLDCEIEENEAYNQGKVEWQFELDLLKESFEKAYRYFEEQDHKA